jgi:hypothetical protein
MHMVVVVMARLAVIFAKRIFDTVIGSGDMVDDAFFHKSLQGSVHGYPVEACLDVLFNIGVRKGTFAVDEQVEYLFPTGGNAELVFL